MGMGHQIRPDTARTASDESTHWGAPMSKQIHQTLDHATPPLTGDHRHGAHSAAATAWHRDVIGLRGSNADTHTGWQGLLNSIRTRGTAPLENTRPSVRLLTRSILLQAARERRLISEGELLETLRLAVPAATGVDMDRALQSAVEDDGYSGRPLLAALVTDDSRAWPWPGLMDGLVRFRRPLPQAELEDWPLRATTERLAALDYYGTGAVRVGDDMS